MTTEFFVAFGGPVVVCLIALVIGLTIAPRGRKALARPDDQARALADAERTVRNAADSIARLRAQLIVGSER